MTRDDIIRMALEALEIGYAAARDEAAQYHAAMAGYRPERHAAMDADVQKIAQAITSIRAALAQGAQAEPVAWIRVIDEAMVVHHLGVADASDDYETAKRKLNNLLCIVQDIGAYFSKQQAEPVAMAMQGINADIARFNVEKITEKDNE